MPLPIELILMRQLAANLRMPVFLVDGRGTLLFYNEPAEALLGRRFSEAGTMKLKMWSTVLRAADERGRPLPHDALPLVVALRKRRPAQRVIRITGLDGAKRTIEVTALPLEGLNGRGLGAVAALRSIAAR
ncbi:MAG TPA: PAS domain-containing protein [bacterium]|nr:PAS domain-containing protein [bacterium]